MTVLITGAAGFIGSRLSESLRVSGEEVIGVDSFSDYYSTELKQQRADFLTAKYDVEVKKLDLSDLISFKSLVEKVQPTSMINLAAQAGIRIPLNQIGQYVNSNLVGFSNFLSVGVEQEIPSMLYASSSSVYGNRSDSLFTESSNILNPISFYGATKLSNELLAPTLVEGSSSRIRGIRFFTVYGPWGRPDMAYFRLANSALHDTEFTLYGNGEITRDFTFIDDVSRCIELLKKELISRPRGYSDVVNVGGGQPASLLEMIRIIEEITNKKIKINFVGKNKNDVNNTRASTEYLKSLIDFTPQVSLHDGLEAFVKWSQSSDISEKMGGWIESTI